MGSCIGRVGGLAVALGVGWAVATTPGLALAEVDGSTSSQSPDNSPPPTSPAGSSPDSDASAGSNATVPSKKNVLDDPRSGVVSSSGGAVSGKSADETLGSDEVSEGSLPAVEVPDKVVEPTVPDDVSAPAKKAVPDNPKRSWEPSTRKSPAAKVQSDAVGTAVSRSQPAQVDRARVDAPDRRAAQQSVSVSVSNLAASPTTPVAAETAPVVATAQMTARPQIPLPSSNPMSTVVIDLLRLAGVGLSPFNSPAAPVESPAMLALLAGWRRQSQNALAGETPIKPADAVQTTEVDGPADASVMQLAAPVSAAAAVAAVDTTPPTVSSDRAGARDRVGHRDHDRHRHRQCRGVRGAVPGERRCVRRRGHQFPLRPDGEHHHGAQRHLHADRAGPRRRRQHHHLRTGERHRRQRCRGRHPAHSESHRAAGRDRVGHRDPDRQRRRQRRRVRGAVPGGQRRPGRRRHQRRPTARPGTPPPPPTAPTP